MCGLWLHHGLFPVTLSNRYKFVVIDEHGATDALGFHAIENPHYITDIHATVMHQLGLDSHQLEIPGRKRLALDHGMPIMDIIA